MRTLRATAVATVVGVMALTAAPAAGAAPAEQPQPAASIESVLPKFEKALTSGKCQKYGKYLWHSTLRVDAADPDRAVEPDERLTKEECRQSKTFASEHLQAFEAVASEEFGTAAVVDATTGGDQATSSIWFLDVDGSWKMISAGPSDGQVGTEPDPAADFDGVVTGWLDALSVNDCAGVWARFVTDATVIAGLDQAQYCADLEATLADDFGATADLAGTPGAEAEPLGGTLDTVFYGVDLPSGRYVTIAVKTVPTDADPAAAAEHSDPGVFEYLTNRYPEG